MKVSLYVSVELPQQTERKYGEGRAQETRDFRLDTERAFIRLPKMGEQVYVFTGLNSEGKKPHSCFQRYIRYVESAPGSYPMLHLDTIALSEATDRSRWSRNTMHYGKGRAFDAPESAEERAKRLVFEQKLHDAIVEKLLAAGYVDVNEHPLGARHLMAKAEAEAKIPVTITCVFKKTGGRKDYGEMQRRLIWRGEMPLGELPSSERQVMLIPGTRYKAPIVTISFDHEDRAIIEAGYFYAQNHVPEQVYELAGMSEQDFYDYEKRDQRVAAQEGPAMEIYDEFMAAGWEPAGEWEEDL